jgi:hypothetical protein
LAQSDGDAQTWTFSTDASPLVVHDLSGLPRLIGGSEQLPQKELIDSMEH